MTRIIITVNGGVVSAVYADCDKRQIDVDVLDYDNMAQCDLETENGAREHEYYVSLEAQLENDGELVPVW